MGFRPAIAWAVLAGLLELGGGLLFALGLFSPLGSLMIAASMLTAIAKVHWPKVWAATGGFELPLVNLAVATAVGLAGGPGTLALDSDAPDNPIENMYIRRVDIVKGQPQSTVIFTYEQVSLFWTLNPEEYLKRPAYTREYPPPHP